MDKSLLSTDLLSICDVYINLAINQKGGTAILISKKMNYELLSSELSADSRIISIRIKYYENVLHFINVYAPASATYSERDIFFQEDLLYYLRNNINNVILGGDWNCVLSPRDCQSQNIQVSKALLNVEDHWDVRMLGLLKIILLNIPSRDKIMVVGSIDSMLKI